MSSLLLQDRFFLMLIFTEEEPLAQRGSSDLAQGRQSWDLPPRSLLLPLCSSPLPFRPYHPQPFVWSCQFFVIHLPQWLSLVGRMVQKHLYLGWNVLCCFLYEQLLSFLVHLCVGRGGIGFLPRVAGLRRK